MGKISGWVGGAIAHYLTQPSSRRAFGMPADPAALAAALRPGDVLLVEGRQRISTAIKYLTQSTWSHAALFTGPVLGEDTAGRPLLFIEADAAEGVRGAPIEEYEGLQTRICRPVGLAAEDVDRVITYARGRIGHKYDLRNVVDLARYLCPTPPVPVAWRRRMIGLGSGDPTRAICSTMIAGAFQSIGYPILPEIKRVDLDDPDCPGCVREILHIRHHSLFTPRDFDVSPYFDVVKPHLEGFDYRMLTWAA